MKILQFIIGITITVVLCMLVVLGLRIFVPQPTRPSYEDRAVKMSCVANDAACFQQQQAEQERVRLSYEQKTKQYTSDAKAYSGRIFVAANLVGFLILIVGLLLFVANVGNNIAGAVVVSGSFGIIYAYIWGWSGADDGVKFVVGLLVAILVIAAGVVINRRGSSQPMIG